MNAQFININMIWSKVHISYNVFFVRNSVLRRIFSGTKAVNAEETIRITTASKRIKIKIKPEKLWNNILQNKILF